MKRILSYTLIMTFAVSLTLFLAGMAGTRAEAASAGKAELTPKAKKAGFIALSKGEVYYADREAFCKRHGGKLPRINNSNSWDGKNPPLKGILIDGFGYGHRPWSEVGLPDDVYWVGTAHTANPSDVWVVSNTDGKVDLSIADGIGILAVCVP